MSDLPLGRQQLDALRADHYSEEDILEYRAQSEEVLRNDGWADEDIKQFYGDPKFDAEEVKEYIKNDPIWHAPMAPPKKAETSAKPRAKDGAASSTEDGLWQIPEVPQGQEGKYNPNAKKAETLYEAYRSGWENSVTGLVANQKLSDYELKPDADWVDQAAHLAGFALGEIGPGLIGAVGGGAAVSAGTSAVATPFVGVPTGIAAGYFLGGAVPAGMRKLLTNKYRKGEIKSAQEFSDLFTGVLSQSMKEGILSLATGGVGAKAGKLVAPLAQKAASKLAQSTITQGAKLSAEAATMGVVGPAVEGRLPEPEDFTNAAVMIAGMHLTFVGAEVAARASARAGKSGYKAAQNAVTNRIRDKLDNVYNETGLTPSDVAQAASNDPVLLTELSDSSKDIPPTLEPYRETPSNKTTITEPVPEILGGGETTTQLEFPFAEIRSEDPATMGKKPTGDTPEGTVKKPTKKEQAALDEKEATRKKYTDVPQAEIDNMPTDDAHKIVRSMIKPYSERIKGTFKERIEARFNKFMTDVFWEYHPIYRLQKAATGAKNMKEALAAIEASNNPLTLLATNKGVVGKTMAFLQHHTFDYKDLKKNGESLADILSTYKSDVEKGQRFEEWLALSRAKEIQESGRKTPFFKDPVTAAASRKAYEAGKAEFAEDAKRVNALLRRALRLQVDSGIKSEKEYKSMVAKGENYIPMMQVQEELPPSKFGKGVTVKDKNNKNLTGAEGDIYAPIESVIRYVHSSIVTSERNRIMKSIKSLMERLPDAIKKVEVDPGVVKDDGAEVIYRSLKDGEIAVFEDGKRTIFEVPKEVADALSGIGSEQSFGFIATMMAKAASSMRAGNVLAPLFTVSNVVRDQQHATIVSDNKFIPLVSFLEGAASFAKKDEAFVNWMKGGGMSATIQSLDRDYISANIQKLAVDTGMMKGAYNVVSSPRMLTQVLHKLTEYGEVPTRIGEFKRSAKGKSDINSIIGGAYDARNVTLDFQKRGAKIAALNAIMPFFNARLQGTYQLGQALRDKPAPTILKGAMLSFASYALWSAQHDDPRYSDAPEWEKRLFWIIPIDNWVPSEEGEEGKPNTRKLEDGSWETNLGEVYRIPKSHEMGMIFGSGVEAVMDSWKAQDPEAAINMAAEIVKSFAGYDAPTALKVPFELMANYSSFYDAPIVDYFTEQNLPYLRFNDNTSEASKFLSKKMHEAEWYTGPIPSPAKMDYAVKGFAGTLGAYALGGLSHTIQALGGDVDKKMDADAWSKLTWEKAWKTQVPKAAKSVNDFYEIYNEEILEWTKSLKTLENRGDESGYEKTLNRPEFIVADALAKDFKAAIKDFKAIREDIAGIDSIPDEKMSKDEKRRAIYQLYWERAGRASYLVNKFKETKKFVKEGGDPAEMLDEEYTDNDDEENEE